MINLPKFLENKDKFYGLADSVLSSIFRFACGIALARIGGAEEFATYIVLITTNVIFLQIPSTCYLTPLLNRGTGAASDRSGRLQKWAQRGVERTALVFLFMSFLAYSLVPQVQIGLITFSAFCLTAVAQLFQLSNRTRLQMQFRQSRVLAANMIGCVTHLVTSATFWELEMPVQSAFWWGAFAGACVSNRLMHIRVNLIEQPKCACEIIVKARKDGRLMLRGSIANSACSRLQPYLLASLGSTQLLAYYGVIWSLIGPIRMLSMAFANLLRPRLALHHNNREAEQFERSYRLTLALLILGGFTATIISFFAGRWAIGFLFGNELITAAQWLCWGMVYATLDAITTCQMIALQIKKENGAAISSRLRIHSAIISLALLVPLTLHLGLSGTFLSLILAEVYYATATRRQDKDDAATVYFTGTKQTTTSA